MKIFELTEEQLGSLIDLGILDQQISFTITTNQGDHLEVEGRITLKVKNRDVVQSLPEQIEIYFDGGARGNPGLAGAGALVKQRDKILAEIRYFLGKSTNNVAEYTGAILGLEKAHQLGAKNIILRGDSQLVIKQLRGEWQVKAMNLRPLYEKSLKLLNKFDYYKLEHIPREENEVADYLANQAIDDTLKDQNSE